MSKLDLSKHTDREIVAALFNMPAHKFFPVMNALGAIADRMTKRGKLIADQNSEELVDDMIRRLFEGESGPEE